MELSGAGRGCLCLLEMMGAKIAVGIGPCLQKQSYLNIGVATNIHVLVFVHVFQ